MFHKDYLEEYRRILNRLSIVPIESVDLDSKFNLCVRTTRGVVTRHKFNTALKMFLILLRPVDSVEKGDDCLRPEICMPAPLMFYDLLGFQRGDKMVLCKGSHRLLTEFS